MRTVIDIDDEALDAAAKELGTTTKVATVNAALRFVADRQRQLNLLEALDRSAQDLADPEVMRNAWR